jgi:hypothetical protein
MLAKMLSFVARQPGTKWANLVVVTDKLAAVMT